MVQIKLLDSSKRINSLQDREVKTKSNQPSRHFDVAADERDGWRQELFSQADAELVGELGSSDF